MTWRWDELNKVLNILECHNLKPDLYRDNGLTYNVWFKGWDVRHFHRVRQIADLRVVGGGYESIGGQEFTEVWIKIAEDGKR